MSFLSKEKMYSSFNLNRLYTDSFDLSLRNTSFVTREFHLGTNTLLQLDNICLYLSITNPTTTVLKLSKNYIQEIIKRISIKIRAFIDKDHSEIIEEDINYAGTFFILNSFIRRSKSDIEDNESDYTTLDEIPTTGIDIRIPLKYMLAKLSKPNIIHCESIVFNIEFYPQNRILKTDITQNININGIFASNAYQMDDNTIKETKINKDILSTFNKKYHIIPSTVYSTIMEQIMQNKTTLSVNIHLSNPYACNLYYVFYNESNGSFNPETEVYVTNHEITANGKTYPFSNNKGFLNNKNHILLQHYDDFLANTNGSYLTRTKWTDSTRIYSCPIYGLIQTQGLILKITLNKGFVKSDIKILIITQVKE
ncbi:hypothetical protein AHEVV2_011 [Adoxophyes honmai entomopoxvirus 'L' virophage 2]|nr:hypothetical protein AHEVV2_011 [Adoxophyes honmai entomopoxvirus 'L' virophage 2]